MFMINNDLLDCEYNYCYSTICASYPHIAKCGKTGLIPPILKIAFWHDYLQACYENDVCGVKHLDYVDSWEFLTSEGKCIPYSIIEWENMIELHYEYVYA